MAGTFHFELVSPERQLVAADIPEAIIPGQEGDLAALPEHALLITQLRPGILTTYSASREEKKYYLRGGFADVGPQETIVLAEYALPLEEFTPEMMTEEIALAQQALDESSSHEARYFAQDRLERLHSLKVHLRL